MELKHSQVTGQVIDAFFRVYNKLGYGFQEKVYQNSVQIELRKHGIQFVPQAEIKVYYEGEEVGEYFADLLVENCVIVELKAARELDEDHEAQLLNYLKATKYEVGLLMNFGKRPRFERKAYANENKGSLEWLSPDAK
ncbi:MAG: GxxExxY protein [Chloroflexi bacterium]|nr:GxxExxY protein [Chloroflexota bacterium]